MNATVEKKQAHTIDANQIRKDFPILSSTINGHRLVYLDNAATSQKPSVVIDAITDYYSRYNSNVHRGVHHLSNIATQEFENARLSTSEFINSKSKSEIIFVRGTTEAINLVASSFGRKFIEKDDEIVITTLEHHSNIVPWQILCETVGAKLKVVPIDDNGEIIFEEYLQLLSPKTKLVSTLYISNALGVINPVKKMIDAAHQAGAKVLVDGAQAVSHQQIDVQNLNCDFFCFSGHKMFGPTGIGVLYGKEELLNEMPPYQGGGEMIKTVTFEKTTYNELPFKFEAGTPNIEGAIGLHAAIEYINSIGYENISEHEHELLGYATERLNAISGLHIYGKTKNKASVISFTVDGIHPYDLGTLLDQQGIAIRTGHHCCEPLMTRFGITGTCRASFAFYNTKDEVDKLSEGIEKAVKILC